ncbi:hypothetical protein RND71_015430 [Anisodus tanguticus]|uniref:Uncharacterized protein n=1 Tax=Anisodus tanguticus TaxID=243964 RepID=A0AAE1VCW0_9SOLA|nr:hypothetical protein RND71_015430 [Anisodus tanguticus]
MSSSRKRPKSFNSTDEPNPSTKSTPEIEVHEMSPNMVVVLITGLHNLATFITGLDNLATFRTSLAFSRVIFGVLAWKSLSKKFSCQKE